MSSPSENAPARSTKRAGAFDIRMIIGTLLGIYGLVVLITGLVTGSGSGAPPHADPDHLNLYVGGGLVVVAGLFGLWTRLRPLRVPTEPPADAAEPVEPAN